MVITTIAFGTVTLTSTSFTLAGKSYMTIPLSSAPNGTVYGSVIVGSSGVTHSNTVEVRQLTTQNYTATLWGGRLGRHTSSSVKVILTDDDGPIEYGTPISITVAEGDEPFVVQPAVWVEDTLNEYWDETYIGKPLIIKPYDRKAKPGLELKKLVEIVEGKVPTTVRGRGDYKDNKYPIEIICRSEGAQQSEDWARMLLAEVRRIMESYWNNITYLGLDFIEFLSDDGQNMSVKSAGRFEWRWNFNIIGSLRGRVGTPTDPGPLGGEVMEVVASLPSVGDARLGIFYLVIGASGTRNKIYYKDKDSSDTYTILESVRPYHSIIISNYDSDTDVAAAGGVLFATIPAWLDGYDLIDATASVDTAGTTSGTTDIMVRRTRSSTDADMLTVPITLAVGEYTISDGTIDTSNDDINTGDRIFIDVDAVNGTAPKGLSVVLTFYNGG